MFEIHQKNLEVHLTQIVRERDPYFATGGHFYVQHYIQQEFAKWGDVEIHEFKVRGKIHQNLILNLPNATNSSKPPILIGAHYDAAVGSPGADDNATGVAVLLELARIFASEPAKYPLKLVAFDLEEYDLLGSFCYASKLRQQQQPLRLMISLEMLGYCDSSYGSQKYPLGLGLFYPREGNFIALIGNLPTIPDLIHISRCVEQVGVLCKWLPIGIKGIILPETRRSDHASFWDNGYQAILITDTANLRNPNYHKPSDTIATLNLAFLTGILDGLVVSIQHLW
jgi:Zn-dependent M28 family amino/carboxypeptidase